MLDWQIVGVVLIVGGAVGFLARRVLAIRHRRNKPAQSFVPITSLKGKKTDRGCH